MEYSSDEKLKQFDDEPVIEEQANHDEETEEKNEESVPERKVETADNEITTHTEENQHVQLTSEIKEVLSPVEEELPKVDEQEELGE